MKKAQDHYNFVFMLLSQLSCVGITLLLLFDACEYHQYNLFHYDQMNFNEYISLCFLSWKGKKQKTRHFAWKKAGSILKSPLFYFFILRIVQTNSRRQVDNQMAQERSYETVIFNQKCEFRYAVLNGTGSHFGVTKSILVKFKN